MPNEGGSSVKRGSKKGSKKAMKRRKPAAVGKRKKAKAAKKVRRGY